MRRTRSLKIDCISLDGYYRTTKVSSFSHVAKPKYIFFVLLSAFCNRPRSKSSPYSLGNRGIFRKIGGLSGEKRSVSSKVLHFFVGSVAWMDSPRGIEGDKSGIESVRRHSSRKEVPGPRYRPDKRCEWAARAKAKPGGACGRTQKTPRKRRPSGRKGECDRFVSLFFLGIADDAVLGSGDELRDIVNFRRKRDLFSDFDFGIFE